MGQNKTGSAPTRLESTANYLDELADKIPAEEFIAKDELRQTTYKLHLKAQSTGFDQTKSYLSAKQTKLDPACQITTTSLQAQLVDKHNKPSVSPKHGPQQAPQIPVHNLDNGLEDLRQRMKARIESMKTTRQTEAEEKPPKKRKNPEEGQSKKRHVASLEYSQLELPAQLDLESTRNKPGTKIVKKRRLLAEAEANRDKVQKLKESYDPESKKQLEGMLWDKALHQVKGEKVLDNPSKIKKSIRRDQVQKKKSTKNWKEIKKQVQQHMQERQKTRNDNLKNKQDRGKKVVALRHSHPLFHFP